MKGASSRYKALAVTFGFSFWFYMISSGLGFFTLESFLIFILITGTLTQIFSVKLSKVLNAFAVFNTKIFLGIIFVCIFAIYGILFKILRIDLLRLKKQNNSYWLEVEQTEPHRIRKQY